MTTGIEFPAFVKIEHKPDSTAEGQFVAAVEDMMSRANRSVSDFASNAKRQLDAALTIKRNEAGALDLGVPEMRAAAQAQQARAVAAREVAEATAAAARATGTYTQEEREAIAATRSFAEAEAEKSRQLLSSANAAQRVQDQLNKGTSAVRDYTSAGRGLAASNDNAVRSTQQFAQAQAMAGQQLTDIAVQIASGQRASTALAQQLPQLAFAFTSIDDRAGAAGATIGSVARFMAGPFGVAIGLAAGSLIDLAFRSSEAEVATKKAEFATYAFGDAQGILGSVIDLTTGRITAQSEALIVLARAQALAGKIEAQRAQTAARAEIISIRKGTIEVRGGFGGGLAVERVGDATADVVSAYQDGTLSVREAERALASLQRTGLVTEQQYLRAAQAVTSFAVANENAKVFDQAERALNGDGGALRGFLKPARSSRARRGSDSEQRKRERELVSLDKLAESAAERISRLNERFDESPRLIDQASQATRELDAIITELAERKPINWQALTADAERAKGTIEEALLRPIEHLRAESNRRMEIDRLILAGREREVSVLSTMQELERTLGAQAWDRLDAVEAIVDAEQRHGDALRAARDEQASYLEATQQIRGELESFFAGEGADFGQIAKRLQARYTVEKLFGPALKAVESEIKAAYDAQIEHYTKETGRAASAAGDLADALDTAATRITQGRDVTSGPGAVASIIAGQVKGGTSSLDAMVSKVRDASGGQIVVIGAPDAEPKRETLGGLRPEQYFEMIGKSLTAPLIDQLAMLGIKLPASIKGALGGALGGYMAAGPVGAVLGGLDGLGIKGALGKSIGKAFGGAQTGSQVDGIMKAIGLQSSQTGAAIGGAIGSFLPIPGGSIIGSVAGGILGGLFKKKPRGSAVLTGAGDGSLSVSGNKDGVRSNLTSAGGSVQESLRSISQALNAELGSFRVSIGSYKDYYRVSASGTSRVGDKKYPNSAGSDLLYDGKDIEEATRIALKNAIEDGVIKGLKASENRLLRAGNDIDKAIQDVLDFRSVFTRLRAYKDPVGAALDELDTEFNRLTELFTRAGASAEEFAKLEELYGIERAQAIEEAGSRVVGSLRSLLQDLMIGDSGLSLRDRQANALAEYQALETRVKAGDVTAFDKYAESAQALLDIERQLFGSQSGYFDRYSAITSTASNALTEQERLTQAAINRDSPFQDNAGDGNKPVVDSIHWLGNRLSGELEQGLGQRLDRIGDLLARSGSTHPQSTTILTMPLIRGAANY